MFLPVTTRREDKCHDERDDTAVWLLCFIDDGCLKIIFSPLQILGVRY